MALFIMILRKMINNKWLELSLLFGLIVCIALTSSMPIYTSAILERMLKQELRLLQENSNRYPGIYWISAKMSAEDTRKGDKIADTDRYLETKGDQFGLPVQYFVRERSTQLYSLLPEDQEKRDVNFQRSATVSAIDGLEDHIRLVDGRLPAGEPVNGVYEALVVKEALSELGMALNDVFIINDGSLKEPVYMKPVGVIDRKDYSDLFWYNIPGSYKNSFFISFELFDKDFSVSGKLNVQSSYWYYALDYTKITLASVDHLQRTSRTITAYMNSHYETYDKYVPALRTVEVYLAKASDLQVVLWSLGVPVFLMLVFYLYMVANLITERQKTEIAVLRSRGASRLQIIVSYAAEGVVLGAVAFFTGPYLGVVLAKILGASSGFLEFVQRAKLDGEVNREALTYSLIGLSFSLLMILIPVYLATGYSIAVHKQQSARKQKRSFWHRYFFDVILIGVALYGLNNYKVRKNELLSLGLSSADLRIDPMLFIIPALFILGLGLLVLRLYPLFLRIVYTAGKRWWPPAVYSTLIQVGRSTLQYHFIMMFLIITIATGLFSASSARTINENTTDKIRYATGADISLKVYWENDAPPAIAYSYLAGNAESDAGNSDSADGVPPRTQYSEPAFLPFTQLPGVEHAAKVFIKHDVEFSNGSADGKVQLMGVNTKDFGETAWMRDYLLDHHINAYLNLIARHPSTVLISKSMQEEYGLQPGDSITLSWPGVEGAQFTVYGVIDYWPSWNPNRGSDGSHKPMLVVGNLTYIQNNLALEPYEVWLKLGPGASSQRVYQAIVDHGYSVESLEDANQEEIKALKDPFLLAVNGMMTLGFLISVLICFYGFLLYWVLSMFSRTLQLGILRAMGVSVVQVIVMLGCEQVMISGAAIVIGIITGSLTSRLFVPLFELTFDPSKQVPPFQVTFDPVDEVRLYWIVVVMISVGLAVLGYFVSRIRIHQAVKLGED
ncbi:FtsX-like permease family protein [Paenibacillus tarimensis]